MHPRKVLAAPVALALLLACGKSKDAERYDAFKAYCQGIVSNHQTFDEASQQFGTGLYAFDCTATFAPLTSGDTCDYNATHICNAAWASYSYDGSRCSLYGCTFLCEIRFVGAPGAQTVDPTTPICGALFAGGQPP